MQNISNRFKFQFLVFIILIISVCGGCGKNYKHISIEEAQQMMNTESNYLIVDVRTKKEYDTKHVPGAVLLPIEEIRNGNVTEVLPDKNQTLMIYCWTGRRAEDSAIMLANMGYKNVYEFGGLINWKGAIEGEEINNN